MISLFSSLSSFRLLPLNERFVCRGKDYARDRSLNALLKNSLFLTFRENKNVPSFSSNLFIQKRDSFFLSDSMDSLSISVHVSLARVFAREVNVCISALSYRLFLQEARALFLFFEEDSAENI